MTVLGDRLLAVHDALDAAGVAHAVGGAIALAYCTVEPRGTRDLDVNVFVGPERSDEVLDALPDSVRVTKANRVTAHRDAQVRVWWDDTPVDLFFDAHDFHRRVADGVRDVPFEGRTIPVLACAALLVFKALYGRPRDWADIEEMLDAEPEVGGDGLAQLRELVGRDDVAVTRLWSLVAARRP